MPGCGPGEVGVMGSMIHRLVVIRRLQIEAAYVVARHAMPSQVAADVFDHGRGAADKRVHVGDRDLEGGVDVGSGEVAMRAREDRVHAHGWQAIALRE